MAQNVIDFIRATTRPVVTYSLVATTIYCTVLGLPMDDWFKGLTLTAVTFWFADRKTREAPSPTV